MAIQTKFRPLGFIPHSYDGLCFTADEDDSTVMLANVAGTYVTSVNGSIWHDYKLGKTITLDKDQKVYFAAKTTNDTCWNRKYSSKFQMTGKIKASGNMQSLLDRKCQNTSVSYNEYCCIFKDCSALITPPELPATTLDSMCYFKMFDNCTSLSVAPNLPAETLAEYCYKYMFSNCASLTSGPVLSVEDLKRECYYGMFDACSSLLSAPYLPATTLTDRCYWAMFFNCTSLTSVQSILPATNLSTFCYGCMFENCKSLIVAPQLPATNLVDNCYDHMFLNCSSLSSMHVSFTTWPESEEIDSWLSGVSNNGMFACPAELPDERGICRIPENWEKQNI